MHARPPEVWPASGARGVGGGAVCSAGVPCRVSHGGLRGPPPPAAHPLLGGGIVENCCCENVEQSASWALVHRVRQEQTCH